MCVHFIIILSCGLYLNICSMGEKIKTIELKLNQMINIQIHQDVCKHMTSPQLCS